MAWKVRYESYTKAAIRGTHCGWCERPFEDKEAIYKGQIPYEGIEDGGESVFYLWNHGPMCESCARARYKYSFDSFYPIGNCKTCGRPVMGTQRRWYTTCCESCRQKIYRPGKPTCTTYATCEGCGESFPAKRTDSKFCSNACRQKAYRKRSSGNQETS